MALCFRLPSLIIITVFLVCLCQCMFFCAICILRCYFAVTVVFFLQYLVTKIKSFVLFWLHKIHRLLFRYNSCQKSRRVQIVIYLKTTVIKNHSCSGSCSDQKYTLLLLYSGSCTPLMDPSPRHNAETTQLLTYWVEVEAVENHLQVTFSNTHFYFQIVTFSNIARRKQRCNAFTCNYTPV